MLCSANEYNLPSAFHMEILLTSPYRMFGSEKHICADLRDMQPALRSRLKIIFTCVPSAFHKNNLFTSTHHSLCSEKNICAGLGNMQPSLRKHLKMFNFCVASVFQINISLLCSGKNDEHATCFVQAFFCVTKKNICTSPYHLFCSKSTSAHTRKTCVKLCIAIENV